MNYGPQVLIPEMLKHTDRRDSIIPSGLNNPNQSYCGLSENRTLKAPPISSERTPTLSVRSHFYSPFLHSLNVTDYTRPTVLPLHLRNRISNCFAYAALLSKIRASAPRSPLLFFTH